MKPGLLKWIPPKLATFIYTVICKPLIFKKIIGFFIKKLIPDEITINQAILCLNTQDPIVSGSLFLGCYETSNIRFFLSELRKNTVFIDVGANIGLYSALACKEVAKNNVVIAVEPDQRNCEILKKTKIRNNFTNLIIEQVAAGDHAGLGHLYLNPLNPADHRLHDQTHSRTIKPVKVELVDNLVKKHDLVQVNLIKIDTQGYEAKVWSGLRETLQKNYEIQILMEFWPWGLKEAGSSPQQLLKSIRCSGFKIYEVTDGCKSPIQKNSDEYLLSFTKERQHLNLFLKR